MVVGPREGSEFANGRYVEHQVERALCTSIRRQNENIVSLAVAIESSFLSQNKNGLVKRRLISTWAKVQL